jgi:hypothetical protein
MLRAFTAGKDVRSMSAGPSEVDQSKVSVTRVPPASVGVSS